MLWHMGVLLISRQATNSLLLGVQLYASAIASQGISADVSLAWGRAAAALPKHPWSIQHLLI